MKKLTCLCVGLLVVMLAGCSSATVQPPADTTVTTTATDTPVATTAPLPELTLTAFSGATEEQLTPYFERVKRAVVVYREGLLGGADSLPSMPMSMTDEAAYVVGRKFAYEASVYPEKTIASAEYTIREWKVVNGALWCTVDSLIEVQEGGATRETVQIVLKNAADPVIVDWYEGSTEDVDGAIRGYTLNLKQSENWLENQDFDAIQQKCEQYLKINSDIRR